ncbi:cupin domain-containing protein [Actinoplanes solisilvae]|uniref:cupin domain-containing protein n=1 Tax=Actinoplanes solisilvae TaxID=2486853 RepID=UPI000FD7DFC9|nr:cupin domain-containing protein [Actinoplanes solisilvae]
MQSTHLTDLARRLLDEARTAHSGRSAHTLFGRHEHQLRQTVIALAAGHELAEHNSPSEATLQVLSGQVTIHAPSGTWTGTAGDHAIIPDERHSLRAEEDSAILLTVLAPRG